MASKTEFKKLLKELNLTEDELQIIYEDVATTNKVVNNFLNISKIKLCDLPIHLIRQLPTQKEKDLEAAEKMRIKEEEEAIERKRIEEEKKHYVENFEKIIIKKIDNGEELTEDELKELVFEYGIESECGDNRRWSRSVETIVELCGRYFAIDWEEGLTESQPNEFYYQPYEVKLNTYEKTITVKEWVKLNRKEGDE